MKIQTLHLVYFSPTGTTRKTLEHIARGTGVGNIVHHDVTRPGNVPAEKMLFPPDEMVFIGAPVYAGRLPDVAAERLRMFGSSGSPTVVAVVYGNRDYEDALLELGELAAGTGFVVIAGGAFIGEHSYSTAETPIAAGRPDVGDEEKAEEFGRDVMDLFRAISKPDEIESPELPGNHPYRDKPQHPVVTPQTDTELCTLCGECVTACPVGAISINGVVTSDAASCILCCACIKNCPEQARAMTDPAIEKITARVRGLTILRKEPVMFPGRIAS